MTFKDYIGLRQCLATKQLHSSAESLTCRYYVCSKAISPVELNYTGTIMLANKYSLNIFWFCHSTTSQDVSINCKMTNIYTGSIRDVARTTLRSFNISVEKHCMLSLFIVLGVHNSKEFILGVSTHKHLDLHSGPICLNILIGIVVDWIVLSTCKTVCTTVYQSDVSILSSWIFFQ